MTKENKAPKGGKGVSFEKKKKKEGNPLALMGMKRRQGIRTRERNSH
jgi:hypothetical protein